MAARALSSATIAFGLVSIPVKLYSAAESSAQIRFNQIDQRDGSRVKQQLISSQSGEIVPREEIVKGYEFSKGQYVLFTKEELKAIEVVSKYTIDIEEFVPAGSVERIYFDKAYYLGPDKGGARAYQLLAKALDETNRIAVGRYAARGKQHLIMVRPVSDGERGGLLLEQLYYADEIRAFDEVPVDDVEVKAAELELAKQLIDQGAKETFDPTSYRDEVRAQILEMIERKVEGEDITIAPQEQPEHKIIDIMEALKASLDASPGRKPAQAAKAKSEASQKPAKAKPKKAAKKKAS
ncbi:MAG TPA: Ku protein [Gammaproteobacteria bacterium]|nr:Ku protein [Gammaproteobacteria bacterium]